MIITNFRTGAFWAYLQMMRPANILTAWADILLGYAASGAVTGLVNQINSGQGMATSLMSVGWLLLSTTGLYGGGVVFNDVFDAELDAQERPERPLPSGRASRSGAIALGSVLLGIGVVAAMQVSWMSAGLAAFIAVAALCYDAIAKHHPVLGPFNMGLCRGANLLLGVSALPFSVQTHWFIALIPIVYIAAITTISRGEVHGGKRSTGVLALLMLCSILAGMFALAGLPDFSLFYLLPFALLFIALVVPPFVRATIEPNPEHIRTAVKAGILCLIILDAAIAAGFTHWLYGLLVLSLLPISKSLAQLFSVT